jgi:regulator of sigma E protease
VLIFIHELGHFLAAKLTGMRVDRFSIGFPPRAFGKVIGDTDYCISWVPLGGYVKIAGMVDETMDVDFANAPAQPWEFRARPMWARMLVISAGVIMNVILAFSIFWALQYSRGRVTIETTEIGYVADSSTAQLAGLQAGDVIRAINGQEVTSWDQIQTSIHIDNMGSDISMDIDRSGRRQTISIPRSTIVSPAETGEDRFGIVPAFMVAVIEGVESGMPAEKAGLAAGDTLISLDGAGVFNSQQVVRHIKGRTGSPVVMRWKRGNETLSGTTTVSNEGRIGIRIGSSYNGPTRTVHYSIVESFSRAIGEVAQSVYLHYFTVKNIVVGRTSFRESMGGPIKIAQFASQSAEYGLSSFLWFMANLSMSLAILNILPIPALDGGHLVMLLYEKIFRREIPHKIKIIIQQAGFVILLALMAFVIYNDIAGF